MNKQEAIEKIKYMDTLNINEMASGQLIDMVIIERVIKNQVLGIVSQIDEPQKPVVPKFVVDWVDDSREYRFGFDEWFDYENQPSKVYDWLNSGNQRQEELNSLALVTLIVNGANAVEIEQEKLYTVEIEGVSSGRLFKNIRTNKYLFHSGKGLKGYTDRLTEKDIEEADELLWQFAKEVK